VLVLLVDGTDRGNAYGEAAATLGDDPSRRWSRPRSCPGWGSRVLWLRSRRSPHCSGERRARAGREDQGWRLADRRFRTVDQPVKDVWDFLTSTEGTGLWLGQRGSRSYVATARMRVGFRACNS
jgi:hypothetical protein